MRVQEAMAREMKSITLADVLKDFQSKNKRKRVVHAIAWAALFAFSTQISHYFRI